MGGVVCLFFLLKKRFSLDSIGNLIGLVCSAVVAATSTGTVSCQVKNPKENTEFGKG